MSEPKPPEFNQGIKPKLGRRPTPAEEKLAAIVKDYDERSKGKKILPLDIAPTTEYIDALAEVTREKEESEARLRSERLKREFRYEISKILSHSGYVEDFLSGFQPLREDTSFQGLANEDIAEVLREIQQHIQALVDISIMRSDGDLKKFEGWKNSLENLGIDFSQRIYDNIITNFLDRRALDLAGHFWTPKDQFRAFTAGWVKHGWRPEDVKVRVAIARYNKGILEESIK